MLGTRYVYQHEGRKSLGRGPMLGIFGAGEWVRSKGHAMKSQWNAAMAAVDLMQASSLLIVAFMSVIMLKWRICTMIIQCDYATAVTDSTR